MKFLGEVNESVKVAVTESATEPGRKDFWIEGVFLQTEIENRNKRIYPEKVMVNEVARYTKDFITTNRAVGELGHPDTAAVNLDLVSHKITELRQSGNDFIGKAKIMNTPRGLIAQEFIREGVQLGVSSRGFGSLIERAGKKYVGEDFHLATVDIVFDPSAPDAFVNGIMESKEFFIESGIVKEKQMVAIQKEVQNLSKKQLDEGALLKLFDKFLKDLR